MDEPGWEMLETENERLWLAVQALNRCAAAGVPADDLIVLARECGVDPNLISITQPKGK